MSPNFGFHKFRAPMVNLFAHFFSLIRKISIYKCIFNTFSIFKDSSSFLSGHQINYIAQQRPKWEPVLPFCLFFEHHSASENQGAVRILRHPEMGENLAVKSPPRGCLVSLAFPAPAWTLLPALSLRSPRGWRVCPWILPAGSPLAPG